MKKLLFSLILVLAACGALRKWGLTPEQKDDIARLDLAQIIAESKLPDQAGMCDGTLFYGLRYYAITKLGQKDSQFDFIAHLPQIVKNGEVFRSTDPTKCFNTSRDMVYGLLLALTVAPGDVARLYLSQMYSYWKAHDWHITENCEPGKGCDNRRDVFYTGTDIPSNVPYLTGRVMAHHGMDVPDELKTASAVDFPIPVPGFRQHLQAVQLAILMEIGEFDDRHLLAGKALASSQTKNAVFRALSGDRRRGYELLDEQFPDGRRPEYCQPYVYQRADSEAYDLCPGSDP